MRMRACLICNLKKYSFLWLALFWPNRSACPESNKIQLCRFAFLPNGDRTHNCCFKINCLILQTQLPTGRFIMEINGQSVTLNHAGNNNNYITLHNNIGNRFDLSLIKEQDLFETGFRDYTKMLTHTPTTHTPTHPPTLRQLSTPTHHTRSVLAEIKSERNALYKISNF